MYRLQGDGLVEITPQTQARRLPSSSKDGFGLAESASVGFVDAQQDPAVGPGQFATQCVTNRVTQKECPHVAEVRLVETLGELHRETLSKPFQKPFAIVGRSLSRSGSFLRPRACDIARRLSSPMQGY